MLPFPVRHPLDWALYLAFGLELLVLCGGLATGRLDSAQTGRLPRWLRMTLSTLLVVAAFLWRLAARGTPITGYATWILAGMAAGSLGDWIMARFIPVPNRLIGGMAAFSVGHVLYSVAMLWFEWQIGALRLIRLAALLALMWALSTWAWHRFVRKPGGSRAINAGSLVYGWIIGTMVACAGSLALFDLRFVALAAGALLFAASDFLLGNWVIRGHSWRSVNDVVWTTYVAGQLLTVYSVSAALSTLA